MRDLWWNKVRSNSRIQHLSTSSTPLILLIYICFWVLSVYSKAICSAMLWSHKPSASLDPFSSTYLSTKKVQLQLLSKSSDTSKKSCTQESNLGLAEHYNNFFSAFVPQSSWCHHYYHLLYWSIVYNHSCASFLLTNICLWMNEW